VTALYAAHYQALTRLAALLLGETAAAEQVVQDSFVAMHAAGHPLRDGDRALRFLRRAVVQRARLAARPAAPDMQQLTGPAADPAVPPVLAALRALAPQQREAAALSLYLDLPADQVGLAMGISPAAARSAAAGAVAALRTILESADG